GSYGAQPLFELLLRDREAARARPLQFLAQRLRLDAALVGERRERLGEDPLDLGRRQVRERRSPTGRAVQRIVPAEPAHVLYRPRAEDLVDVAAGVPAQQAQVHSLAAGARQLVEVRLGDLAEVDLGERPARQLDEAEAEPVFPRLLVLL